LYQRGVPIKAIARRLELARNTVRRWIRGVEPELDRARAGPLYPHLPVLERRWAQGCRNGAQLWRELRETGFTGSLRVVTEWATRQRLATHAGWPASGRSVPSSRRVARMLSADPETLSGTERAFLGRLLAASPDIAIARDLVQRFGAMVRSQRADDLARWLRDAAQSALRSFAVGLRQDEAAVRAALGLPWSNGQVEGQITKLKLIKRQMYGRAKLDLLRVRLLHAA
jgi:transposase